MHDDIRRITKVKTEPRPLTFVEFSIGKERVQSNVVKENCKTVWVKAPDGNVVNRHKIKHNVMAV